MSTLTSESKINTDVLRTWVDALRSGEYLQTTGKLHDSVGYCCLGVACELAPNTTWGPGYEDTFMAVSADGLTSEYVLPIPVMNWLGVSGESPEVPWSAAYSILPELCDQLVADHVLDHRRLMVPLSALNDNGATFAQIADIIEAAWLL